MEEARGLHSGDATRPRDIVILDFAAEGRHLIFDGVVTTIYRKSILMSVAVLGYAAKQVKDKKLKADADSPRLVATVEGGRHTFVPFAMEDGCRIGAHAQAALTMLVEYAITKGRLPPRARHAAPPLPPIALAL